MQKPTAIQMTLKKMALAMIIGLMASTAFVATADAREKNRSGSFVTGKGKSGTYSGQRSGNLKEGLNRTQSMTGANGKTHTRNTTAIHDRETGSFNKTVTGANGSTTRNTTATYDKETGSFNKTVTGDNGKTLSYSGTAEDGQRFGTYATGSGKTGTFNTTVQKNEDGSHTSNRSWTDQNGKTKNRSATQGYDRETNTGTRTITNNQGKTRTGSITVIPNRFND